MSPKMIQLSKDLVTVAEFTNHAGTYLDRVRDTGHPIVITKNGKAAGVVISPEEFDRLQTQHREFVRNEIREGDADIAAGRVMDSKDARSYLEQRRKQKRTTK